MNVLIIGNGGREHAIGWSLASDTRICRLYFSPGNAGTASLGENLPIKADDLESLATWSRDNKPDLVVIGPEAPLCIGVADALRALGIRVFGPGKDGARLEGSKIFTKEILVEAGIPTAASGKFSDPTAARDYCRQQGYPLVVKADGLAAGKGVIIAQSYEEADEAIRTIMEDKVFGSSGNEVLIEEFLDGQEASIHAVTDGENYVLMPSSQDHKRIYDNDQGPNTGGMGAYAPAPVVTPELLAEVERTVFLPLINTLRKRGIDYCGVLYGGLMLTSKGPKVLEFNCRFGDPETEVLLPLLETPLLDLINAAIDKQIGSLNFRIKPLSAMTVVLAAPGYPEKPVTGQAISGLEGVDSPDGTVFQAGTTAKDGAIITSGGRVLAATGWASTLPEARDKAYERVSKISFEGMQFRRDIGHRALK